MLACCTTSQRCFYNTKLEKWMDCYHNNRGLVWDNGYLGLCLQLAGVSLDFCSLKVTRISIAQLLGQRNFSGLFLFVWVGWFFVWVFPVDNEKILLLGRQNPALTRFQSLSTTQFIRQTRMVHIKSIFSSCFSILTCDRSHFASICRHRHRQAALLGVRRSSGALLPLSVSLS